MGDSEESAPELAHVACREVVELITSYLEHALTPEDRARFERHISICPNCAAYLEQMRLTMVAVGRVSEEDIPPGRREELVGLFRDWRNS